MPPTTDEEVPPVPLLFIIELPFGNISECLRGALFPPVSIRFADVSELLSLTGNALEFLFVTPFLTRFVGVLSVLLPEAAYCLPPSPAF